MTNGKPRAILVINPNTTQAMTEGLKPLVNHLGYDTVYMTLELAIKEQHP